MATTNAVEYTFERTAANKASLMGALAKIFNLSLAASTQSSTKTTLVFKGDSTRGPLAIGVNVRKIKKLSDLSLIAPVQKAHLEYGENIELDPRFFTKLHK